MSGGQPAMQSAVPVGGVDGGGGIGGGGGRQSTPPKAPQTPLGTEAAATTAAAAIVAAGSAKSVGSAVSEPMPRTLGSRRVSATYVFTVPPGPLDPVTGLPSVEKGRGLGLQGCNGLKVTKDEVGACERKKNEACRCPTGPKCALCCRAAWALDARNAVDDDEDLPRWSCNKHGGTHVPDEAMRKRAEEWQAERARHSGAAAMEMAHTSPLRKRRDDADGGSSPRLTVDVKAVETGRASAAAPTDGATERATDVYSEEDGQSRLSQLSDEAEASFSNAVAMAAAKAESVADEKSVAAMPPRAKPVAAAPDRRRASGSVEAQVREVTPHVPPSVPALVAAVGSHGAKTPLEVGRVVPVPSGASDVKAPAPVGVDPLPHRKPRRSGDRASRSRHRHSGRRSGSSSSQSSSSSRSPSSSRASTPSSSSRRSSASPHGRAHARRSDAAVTAEAKLRSLDRDVESRLRNSLGDRVARQTWRMAQQTDVAEGRTGTRYDMCRAWFTGSSTGGTMESIGNAEKRMLAVRLVSLLEYVQNAVAEKPRFRQVIARVLLREIMAMRKKTRGAADLDLQAASAMSGTGVTYDSSVAKELRQYSLNLNVSDTAGAVAAVATSGFAGAHAGRGRHANGGRRGGGRGSGAGAVAQVQAGGGGGGLGGGGIGGFAPPPGGALGAPSN